jgi:DNA-binding transcriptional LysR family regulator
MMRRTMTVANQSVQRIIFVKTIELIYDDVMTLDQLRIFVAVAERLHFTKAARHLNLTQSAVSAAVAALEARAGFDLFHRVGRRVELSSQGALFLAEARRVLMASQQADAMLDDLAGLHRGRLTVMGSQTIGAYWLPPLLHRFRQLHSSIAVELSIGNTAQVTDAVVAGVVDIGFVEGDVDHPALQQRRVDDDRMALVVGERHRWAADRELDVDAVRRLPWILRERGSGTRAATEALLASRGLTVADVGVALELPSNEAVRTAVEAGAGASVLSTLVVATSLRAGVLVTAACALPARDFTALKHRERRLGRTARALLDLVLPGDFRG